MFQKIHDKERYEVCWGDGTKIMMDGFRMLEQVCVGSAR